MMREQKQSASRKARMPKPAAVATPAHSVLTRDNLETSMIRWAYLEEGPIAGHYITRLIGHGAVLDALESVAESMQSKPGVFDNDVAMVQTAWMNYQQFGSPGFPVSSASHIRDSLAASIEEVEIGEDEE